MAPSKLRKAIGSVKDKTSIGLIKVGSTNSLTQLDVSVVKATRHEECPPDERHIRQILHVTCHSRAHVTECVRAIARRLNKTKNWVVALKTLMLIHRLLSDGDVALYEEEIFFATRRGTRFLNMADFRDSSGRANAWDYSAFVRTYALYLDERLEYRMQGRRATPVSEMKNEQIFSRVHHLMQILDRFMACRPTGAARDNRIVTVVLYPIVKESFELCFDMTEIMGVLIERFMQLQVPDMIRVQHIFGQVSKLYDEIDSFHGWCKIVGIGRSLEYPNIEKIPQKKLEVMDEYIREKSAMLSNRRVAKQETVKDEESIIRKTEDNRVEEEKKMNQLEKGDLIDLNEDEGDQKLAISLFDANTATLLSSNREKASLVRGFDMLMLDSCMNGERHRTSEMEQKQLTWQRFARDGMQG